MVLLCFTSKSCLRIAVKSNVEQANLQQQVFLWMTGFWLFRSHPAAVFLRSLHGWFFPRRSNAALFSWIIDLLLLARVQESTQRFFSASQRVKFKKKLPMDTEKLLFKIWLYSCYKEFQKGPLLLCLLQFLTLHVCLAEWDLCYARNNESALDAGWMPRVLLLPLLQPILPP